MMGIEQDKSFLLLAGGERIDCMSSTMPGRSAELRNLGAAVFITRFQLFVLRYNLLTFGAWIAWLFGALGGDREAHEKVDLAFGDDQSQRGDNRQQNRRHTTDVQPTEEAN
jgi:hypothetical protein